ncbi:MAG: right-handed parallel beta-helix repeat-containing protein [Planctomycetota bacterium]
MVGRGGKIAFQSDRDSNAEIYVMNADGSGQTRLTNDAGADVAPCWSPDGTKIVFASNRASGYEIYTMDADGSNVTPLTNTSGDNNEPVWSPDGTKIAFQSFRDSDWEIYVMNANGSAQTNISNTAGTDQDPAWSPDGTKIAFVSLRGGDLDLELYTMDADGSNQTALTADSVYDISPWWSPDGALILYSTFGTANDEVYTRNATDGSGLNNLSNTAGSDGKPVWSWAAPANYRSIGTDTAVLHSAGTATISPGSTTLTISGTTLPANVGVGDRIDIQGVAVINQEQSVKGGGASSPYAAPAIQGGTDQTYVLLIATRNNADVTNVTGGAGLTWTEQVEQCSGNSNTRTEIWTATGSPGGSFTPIITFTPNDTLAVVLLRYSGVGTLEAASGENTNADGACVGGVDDTTALLTLTSTVSNSIHLIGVNPQRNSLSNPTAGYSLVNSIVSGAGPSQQRLAVYGRTVGTAGADPFQVSINKTTDWSTAGIVLNPRSGVETLHVKSRDSDTQVTTHRIANMNHTNQTYTIKRAYNTLQAWEDDREGDLVTLGDREVGVCYNDSTGPFTGRLVISGSTTDVDHYMHLTVAEGQRHTGLYNTGARIDAQGGWSGNDAITVEDEYTRIEWLEIKAIQDAGDGIFFASSPPADNGLVSNVLVHSFWQNGNAAVRVEATGITVRNCFITGGTSQAIRIETGGGVSIENCTLWGYPLSGSGIQGAALSTVSVKNTISVNHDAGLDVYIETAGGATIPYFGNNMFASWGGGFDPDDYDGGNQSPPADLEDLFVEVTVSPYDLHLEPTGNYAIDNGLDLSAGFTHDIDDQGRGAWDIGADEVFFNHRSIGTDSLTLHSDGIASIEKGSTTVNFGGTASLPTNVGAGDELVIGADTYYMVARNSPTQATVHQPASTTHSNDTYTIKRAYNTLQDWENARQGDLMAEDRREVGVAYNDSPFTAGVWISNSTTDSRRFLKLTVAEGQRHDGVAGSAAGVVIDGARISVSDDYSQIEWLKLRNVVSGYAVDQYTEAYDVLIGNLLIHDTSSALGAIRVREKATIRNTFIADAYYGIVLVGSALVDALIENVTIYGSSVNGVKQFSGGGTASVRNTIAVGSFQEDFRLVDAQLSYFGYNMYSTTTDFDPANYQGKNASPPLDLEDLFISTSLGSEDMHLEPSGHNAGNRGFNLSASFADDIDGVIRTGGWDMGADEAIPGLSTPVIVSWQEVAPQ